MVGIAGGLRSRSGFCSGWSLGIGREGILYFFEAFHICKQLSRKAAYIKAPIFNLLQVVCWGIERGSRIEPDAQP